MISLLESASKAASEIDDYIRPISFGEGEKITAASAQHEHLLE